MPGTLRSVLLSTLVTLSTATVITKPDGLKIEDTRPIDCSRPTKNGDKISVHYKGMLLNGKVFDESWSGGQPFRFTLGLHEVIGGWDEGLLDACVGVQRKLIIPPELGYGSRGAGASIPPDSVLVFETQLMHIEGVPEEQPKETGKAAEEATNNPEQTAQPANADNSTTTGTQAEGSEAGPEKDIPPPSGECRLLGPFALVVQGVLGLLAMLSLVVKRYREHPRRPVKVWFFDASKQVAGTALLHVANLAMSMLSSGSAVDAARHAAAVVQASKTADDEVPNPCSFYLLNLAIDTTIGIPILVVLLRLFHAIALRTPLANPPESLKSGYYGEPPHVNWWMKQSLLYFLGLFGMKLFVLLLFAALPWLPWVGDWALRWTEGNESLQIAFVMFLFPLAMNALQYYIIDAFIKEDKGKAVGYQSVQQDESGGGTSPGGRDHEDDGDVDGASPMRMAPESGEHSRGMAHGGADASSDVDGVGADGAKKIPHVPE